MKRTRIINLCICISLLLGGCDSLTTESAETINYDDIANDIVSGIGNKLNDVGTSISLTYIGKSNTIKELAEVLKSEKISSEMKSSRFFRTAVSVVSSDCAVIEEGESFAERKPMMSVNYLLGRYRVDMSPMIEGLDMYEICDAQNKMHYYVNDTNKIYCEEELSSSDINSTDRSYLGMLEFYRELAINGKITETGRETVNGKEMEYEEIEFFEDKMRFYFEDDRTMYMIDTSTGAYMMLSSRTSEDFTVPFGYKKVSMEELTYKAVLDAMPE